MKSRRTLLLLVFTILYTISSVCHGKENLQKTDCKCSHALQPVCGSDGLTYENECTFNCAAALMNGLSLAYKGKCNGVKDKNDMKNIFREEARKILATPKNPNLQQSYERRLVKRLNPVSGKYEYIIDIVPSFVITPYKLAKIFRTSHHVTGDNKFPHDTMTDPTSAKSDKGSIKKTARGYKHTDIYIKKFPKHSLNAGQQILPSEERHHHLSTYTKQWTGHNPRNYHQSNYNNNYFKPDRNGFSIFRNQQHIFPSVEHEHLSMVPNYRHWANPTKNSGINLEGHIKPDYVDNYIRRILNSQAQQTNGNTITNKETISKNEITPNKKNQNSSIPTNQILVTKPNITSALKQPIQLLPHEKTESEVSKIKQNISGKSTKLENDISKNQPSEKERYTKITSGPQIQITQKQETHINENPIKKQNTSILHNKKSPSATAQNISVPSNQTYTSLIGNTTNTTKQVQNTKQSTPDKPSKWGLDIPNNQSSVGKGYNNLKTGEPVKISQKLEIPTINSQLTKGNISVLDNKKSPSPTVQNISVLSNQSNAHMPNTTNTTKQVQNTKQSTPNKPSKWGLDIPNNRSSVGKGYNNLKSGEPVKISQKQEIPTIKSQLTKGNISVLDNKKSPSPTAQNISVLSNQSNAHMPNTTNATKQVQNTKQSTLDKHSKWGLDIPNNRSSVRKDYNNLKSGVPVKITHKQETPVSENSMKKQNASNLHNKKLPIELTQNISVSSNQTFIQMANKTGKQLKADKPNKWGFGTSNNRSSVGEGYSNLTNASPIEIFPEQELPRSKTYLTKRNTSIFHNKNLPNITMQSMSIPSNQTHDRNLKNDQHDKIAHKQIPPTSEILITKKDAANLYNKKTLTTKTQNISIPSKKTYVLKPNTTSERKGVTSQQTKSEVPNTMLPITGKPIKWETEIHNNRSSAGEGNKHTNGSPIKIFNKPEQLKSESYLMGSNTTVLHNKKSPSRTVQNISTPSNQTYSREPITTTTTKQHIPGEPSKWGFDIPYNPSSAAEGYNNIKSGIPLNITHNRQTPTSGNSINKPNTSILYNKKSPITTTQKIPVPSNQKQTNVLTPTNTTKKHPNTMQSHPHKPGKVGFDIPFNRSSVGVGYNKSGVPVKIAHKHETPVSENSMKKQNASVLDNKKLPSATAQNVSLLSNQSKAHLPNTANKTKQLPNLAQPKPTTPSKVGFDIPFNRSSVGVSYNKSGVPVKIAHKQGTPVSENSMKKQNASVLDNKKLPSATAQNISISSNQTYVHKPVTTSATKPDPNMNQPIPVKSSKVGFEYSINQSAVGERNTNLTSVFPSKIILKPKPTIDESSITKQNKTIFKNQESSAEKYKNFMAGRPVEINSNKEQQPSEIKPKEQISVKSLPFFVGSFKGSLKYSKKQPIIDEKYKIVNNVLPVKDNLVSQSQKGKQFLAKHPCANMVSSSPIGVVGLNVLWDNLLCSFISNPKHLNNYIPKSARNEIFSSEEKGKNNKNIDESKFPIVYQNFVIGNPKIYTYFKSRNDHLE